MNETPSPVLTYKMANNSDAQTGNRIRRTVYFTGRVQGVGFRYQTCEIARQFAVDGHVRNLPDGRVEAVIEGDAAEVDRFQQAVSDAMKRNITGVSVEPGMPTEDRSGFHVRY